MSGLKEPDELEPAQGSLRLASPDDTSDAADWEAASAAVLRKTRRLREDDPDSAVWQALTRTSLDGVEVAPIGSPASVEGLVTSGRPDRAHDWDVRTHLVGPDAKRANEAALVDLENGATSLWLELGSGLRPADLPTVLEGVLVDLAPVVLDAAGEALPAARALLDLVAERGVTAAPGTNLGADPVGDVGDLVEVARLALDAGVLGVVVDAAALHDRGASDAQELGYSLAVGIAALRALTDAGLGLDEALSLVEFRYAATDEQFPTIAKLRAARRLWARVVELSGGAATGSAGPRMRQHVVTSRAMMGKYDPWVNMLRGTVGAFAAGVGGAEAVTVVPFDAPLGLPDTLGRRVARNTSSLLISESHLARVADPAGGSYAVERLTDDLAVAGWAELGRIEESGGVAAALADGTLQGRVDEVVAERERQVAHRVRPLTGVSEFPNLAEVLPERAPHPGSDKVRRYGASYEALRDHPATGPVFLATLGSVAAHTARATFATNLFAAGGVPVVVAGPTEGPREVLAAYDGQPVVCLAGSDAAYAGWGAQAAALLREAGATRVVLAGKPGERTLPADLVDDSCAAGDDALAFLTRTREALA
jgi:methylmalonyl-CoA mutase